MHHPEMHNYQCRSLLENLFGSYFERVSASGCGSLFKSNSLCFAKDDLFRELLGLD